MIKPIKIGISALVILSMMVTNAFTLKAEEPLPASSTSPDAIPTVSTDSTDGKVHVTENSKWTNAEKTEGEITLNFKTDYEDYKQTEDPIDFVFVVDQSGSMSGERTAQLKKALNESAETLLGGSVDNRLSLVSFGSYAQTLTDFTKDTEEFKKSINKINPRGQTAYSSGLMEANRLINARRDTSRKTIVIFMSDGGFNDAKSSIINATNQLKAQGVEIYTVQYLQGYNLREIMKTIASGDEKTYNASTLKSINDVYKDIISNLREQKTYKDLELKLNLENTNFEIKGVQTNGGTATQSGNGLNWNIPTIKSGESSSLTLQFKLKDDSLEGNLNIHEVATLKATGVTETTTPIQLNLNSSTLRRFVSTITYNGNGNTEGTVPISQTEVDGAHVDVAKNPGGLSRKGEVFKGWQRSDTQEIVGNILVMPESDVILEAIWGGIDIEMNTQTKINGYDMKKLSEVIPDVTLTSATAIAFVDYIDESAATTWDMSAEGNGSIKAWMDGTNLYIGSKGIIKAPSDSSSMFANLANLKTIKLDNFNTSQVINMHSMFNGCAKLTSLDVSHFNTSQVTDMGAMFKECNAVTALDLSRFDTSQVLDLGDMFFNCSNLTLLDVSHFDTSQVVNMRTLFYKCSSLTSLDVSNFDTSQALSLDMIFGYCQNLTSLDVSNFNTSKAMMLFGLFLGCSGLSILDLSNFDFNNAISLSQIFGLCNNLTTVYAKDQATADKLNVSQLKPAGLTVQVKPATAALTRNQEKESLTNGGGTVEASKTLSIRPALLDKLGTLRSKAVKTTVEGGQIAPETTVDYIIYAKYDGTNAKDRSGVMTISNPLPDGTTYKEGSAVSGVVTRQVVGDGGQVKGYIYDVQVVDNVLTFKVNGLSAGAQIGLYYEVTAPTNPSGSYREFLNNATVSMDSLGETSNYVRHFFGADTETKYSFTYSYNGSEPSNAPDVPMAWNYTENQVVNIQNVSMPGYLFNGWTYNGNPVTNTMTMPADNVVLVGSWTQVEPTEEVKAKVTYQYGGEVPAGVALPKEESYTVGNTTGGTEKITGKSVNLANVPTAEDYEFLGWSSSQLSDEEIGAGSFELGKENVIITGNWKKKEYQVKYEYLDVPPVGAPALPSAESHAWGSEVQPQSKANDLSTYVFDGWYTNNSIDPDYEEGFTMPKEDVTFYAAWSSTEGTYKIEYEYEGEVPSDVSGGRDQCFKNTTGIIWAEPETSIKTNALGEQGVWSFDGWTSEDVTIGSDGSFTMPEQDITIKGTWSFKAGAVEKKVTFKIVNGTWSDGGSEDKQVLVSFLNGKGTLKASDIPNGMQAGVGYTNGKWLVAPDTSVDGVRGEVTYTYAFEKAKYDIGYKEEGGSIGGLIEEIEYGKNVILKDENGSIQGIITIGPDTGEIIIPTIEGKYLVRVEESKDENGNVILQPIYATIETEMSISGNSEGNNQSKTPETGDRTKIMGSMMMLMVSGGVLYFLNKKRYKA